MSPLLIGKIVETIGAALLAYVGVRAAVLEWFVGRHLYTRAAGDVEQLRAGLAAIADHRKRQFGFYEVIIIGIGALLIFVRCVVYLRGLWTGH